LATNYKACKQAQDSITGLYHGKIISFFHSWKPRVDSNLGEQHFNTDSKVVRNRKKKEEIKTNSFPWLIV